MSHCKLRKTYYNIYVNAANKHCCTLPSVIGYLSGNLFIILPQSCSTPSTNTDQMASTFTPTQFILFYDNDTLIPMSTCRVYLNLSIYNINITINRRPMVLIFSWKISSYLLHFLSQSTTMILTTKMIVYLSWSSSSLPSCFHSEWSFLLDNRP